MYINVREPIELLHYVGEGLLASDCEHAVSCATKSASIGIFIEKNQVGMSTTVALTERYVASIFELRKGTMFN